ncbi:MAG: hypothetical protein HY894_02620 [Deltaproteobacteria bacterium]|nr:hypothetical protein [Deltaproteobacteria bacterium]
MGGVIQPERLADLRRARRVLAVIVALAALGAADAVAMPFVARQAGRGCTYCHSVIPKLNETGRAFRSNGYRFDSEGAWDEVKDLSSIPASVEVEVEAAFSRTTASGAKTRSSDLAIDEAELSAGGAFGKTGRVSVMSIFAVSQTAAGYETALHRAFAQVNDLAGGKGAGALNLRAGQWRMGLPFLNAAEAVITNAYLAQSAQNILTLDQRAIELNGTIAADDGSYAPRTATRLAYRGTTSSATASSPAGMPLTRRRSWRNTTRASYTGAARRSPAQGTYLMENTAWRRRARPGQSSPRRHGFMDATQPPPPTTSGEVIYRASPRLLAAARYDLLKKTDKIAQRGHPL